MTARTTTTLLLTISDMLLLHCVYRSRCLAKSRLLLCLQESSQIEADTCLWMQTTFVVARTRTKQEGKVCFSQGTSDRLACKSFFFSLWIEPRAKDAELFVSEPKRTSLLFSGFAKKFKIISCFLYIHVLRIISSRHTFWARTTNNLLQVQPWFLQFSFYHWGAVGALPHALVSILCTIGEDFLRGVCKLTSSLPHSTRLKTCLSSMVFLTGDDAVKWEIMIATSIAG